MTARSSGLFSKAWEKLRSLVTKETFVGADANGNRYYRFVEKDAAGAAVERRRVRVPGNDLLYDPKVIPPEWRSWLAKTRQEPPTEEEMAQTAMRKAVMAQRVAAIEEREQQRRIRMESLGSQANTAAGPDINRFMQQLDPTKSAAVGQTPPGGSSSSSSAGSGTGSKGR
eukprot:GHUV01005644.1.p1 GENE.GHUV01005644.1~~GHUV01005644.1.p1  ORF type:complete len:170 (+),score=53.52 GHUV01005644.1:535-1044(+)